MKSLGAVGVAFLVSIVAARAADVAEAERIRTLVAGLQARLQSPSLSVAILRNGQLIFNEAVGFADLEGRIKASAGTVYPFGSAGKEFTAAGILCLVEKGKLKLDDPVRKYLPEAPADWEPVRLHHLLRQNSGIREFLTLPEVQKADDPTQPTSELLGFILQQPLGFAPGSRWSYSNSNYTLLAAIIEKITGGPYDEFLRAEFFEPLGLSSLHHGATFPEGEKFAKGYHVREGTSKPAPPENMNWCRGDGGLSGTAADLVRWADALARGKVVKPASYQQMITPERTTDGRTAPYGFGLSRVPLDGMTKVAHHGAVGGFTAMLSWYPEKEVAIAVLANRSRLWMDSVEKEIARALFDLPAPQFRDLPLAAADRERYMGTFTIGITDLPVKIVSKDQKLRMEMSPPGPSGDLRYQGEGMFVLETVPDGVQLQFSGEEAPSTTRETFHGRDGVAGRPRRGPGINCGRPSLAKANSSPRVGPSLWQKAVTRWT